MVNTLFLRSVICCFIVALSASSIGYATKNFQLFEAIHSDNLNLFKDGLEAKKNKKNIFNRAGQTLLYVAVDLGRLEIVRYLLEQGFDPNDANDPQKPPRILPKNLTLSTYNSHLFRPKKLLSPRKRSMSHPHYDNTERITPIFALLRDKPQKNDLKIAKLLIKYGDQVNNEFTGSTLIDILLNELLNLAKTYQNINKPDNTKIIQAKKLLLKSVSDRNFRSKLIPFWHFFANGKTTAEIITTISHSKETIDDFLPLLVKWRLDPEIPTPDIALYTYQKSHKYMSEPEKFIMLYKYILSWFATRGDIIIQEKSMQSMTLKQFFALKPVQVAEMIFYIDNKNFAIIANETIALKFIQNQSNPKLDKFLARANQLSELVELSIVEASRPEKALKFWREVALHLQDLGDFFGLLCIRTGLNSDMSIGRLREIANIRADALARLIDVSHHQTYVSAKNESAQSGYIPAIMIEAGKFKNYFSDTPPSEMFSDGPTSLAERYKILEQEFDQPRKALLEVRRNLKFAFDPRLYNFLANLDSYKKSAELLALDKQKPAPIALSEPTAEYWSARELFVWWQEFRPKISIEELLHLDISDGPALIEMYAFHLAHPEREIPAPLAQLFNTYLTYCKLNATTPLAPLKEKLFEDKLIVNTKSPFAWIMWLRNHDLSETIPKLLRDGIVNFEDFLMERSKNGEFNSYDQKANASLEHLFTIYELSKNLPDPIEEWELKHLESWLFIKGFDHFKSLVFKYIRNRPHRFFAYCYLLKTNPNLAFKSGMNEGWLDNVLQELDMEYDIEEAIERLLRSDQTNKKLNSNYLYFFGVLKELSMTDSLPKFYMNGIRSVLDLKKALRVDEEFFTKIGLSVEDVEKLTLYLDNKGAAGKHTFRRRSARI